MKRMSPRERLLAVYRGETPDCVPALADLSYWHAAHGGGKFIPGATDGANVDRIPALLALHRRTGAAIHVNLGCFYREQHDETVVVRSGIDGEFYRHCFKTPVGSVEEVRRWSPATYSWPIVQHLVRGVDDLRVIRYLFERVRYLPCWEAFDEATAMVGELGVALVQAPYTGLGFLVSHLWWQYRSWARCFLITRWITFLSNEPMTWALPALTEGAMRSIAPPRPRAPRPPNPPEP